MPLLQRSPFLRQAPPTGLRPNDEVFHCKLTGEVFDDYEKFFERIILCNSLVWSCALTGHPNLTFQEALQSEKRAQEQLSSFPSCMQSPLIYLAHLTHRSRFNDVMDDVYSFAKDRYFIGETVSVETSDGRVSCKIVEVIPPSENKTTNTKCTEDDSDSDVICLDGDDDDDFHPPPKKIKLSDCQRKEDENKQPKFGPDPQLYRYHVQDLKNGSFLAADAKNICRRKSVFSREKCKLFLKQHCNVMEDGIWKVKGKYAGKFRLSTLAFSDFFAGPLPSFEVSEAKKRRPSAKVASENDCQTKTAIIDLTEDDDFLPEVKAPSQQKGKKKQEKRLQEKPNRKTKTENKQNTELLNIDDEFRRMRQEIADRAKKREQEKLERQKAKETKKEELRKKADEKRQKRKEELEKKKQERKQQDALLRESNKPREDLECEDLKALPNPTPVCCAIPSESFGDAVLVLEYLLCFQAVFEFNLPKIITIDVFAKALNDVDIDGLYFDIVRELLTTIFRLQDEDREEAMDEKDIKVLLEGLEEYEDTVVKELIKSATLASQWPVVNYATPLRKLHLDSYTLTEVVRLHLLSSGSLSGLNLKYDYQQRGGYTSRDDPGLTFCQQEAAVVELLGRGNIFDMSCSDKLKIITILIHQLLTYVMSRDIIDENCEKLKQIQRDLRQLHFAEQKRDKDETQYRLRKRLEEYQQQNTEADPPDESMDMEIGVEETVKRPSGSQKKATELMQWTDYNYMSTENIDWSKIAPEERARMKVLYEKKEKELMDVASELQHTHSICPLGRDRTFRRFWVFRSVPGLFVEDEEAHIPAEFFRGVSDDLAGKRDVRDCSDDVSVSESERSDKENIPAVPSDGTGSNNAAIMNMGSTLTSNSSGSPAKKIRWAFYGTSNEIDDLVESLNPRGLRESLLRSALLEQMDWLKEWLCKCNFQALANVDGGFNGNTRDRLVRPQSRQLLSIPKYASAQENLEKNLRDMLLDIEERIFIGSLGNLKVKDRIEWRVAIDEGRYDPLAESAMVVCKPVLQNGLLSDKCQHTDESTNLNVSMNDKPSAVVRGLAKALLQVEQMLECRYLTPPLGKEVGKKPKQKVTMDAVRNMKRDGDTRRNSPAMDSDEDDRSSASSSALERWEESLMSSNSLAQIFLHLAVLESSVTWSKSALHARCRICRRKGDGERMLLCDGCDRGHHMYCLKPPVKIVPEGDWFCPSCVPKDVLHTPRKNAKVFSEDISEDENIESSSASEDDDESEQSDEESSGELATEDDGEDRSSSEEEKGDDDEEEDHDGDDDDDDSEDNSDSEIAIKASAKIKFVKNVPQSRKNSLPIQAATNSLNHVKTRLRATASLTSSGIEETRLSFETKRKDEPINGQLKLGFRQTDDHDRTGASRSRHHQKQVGLKSEETGGIPKTFGTKRSRRSLEQEQSNVDTGKRSKQLRTSLDMNSGRITRSSDASHSSGSSRLSLESGTSTGQRTFTTKSREKVQQSLMKTCEDLVNELMLRDEAWPFLKPVTRREAPDYFDIIKRPMDLSVIRTKVKRLEYLQPSEILDDIRLIFSNFKEYNMPTAPVYTAGQKLESYFEKRFRELKLQPISTSPCKSTGSESRLSPKKLRKRTL